MKKIICFFLGHNWVEFSHKSMGNYIYYADRKCGMCGEVEILKNDYAYKIEYLDEAGGEMKC